jgi:alkanesulfonate monooxygenase SsuD/methylene tetrahydromethanopterin reductase-like flavin-dependent oxidoreductase (luciferase family)
MTGISKQRGLRSHWQRACKLILAKEIARVAGRGLARHTDHLAGRHDMSTRPKPPPYPKPPRPPAEPPRPQPGASMLCAALALAIMTAPTGAQEDIDRANVWLPYCKQFLAEKATFWAGVCLGTITALAFVGRDLSDESRFCARPLFTQ